MALATRCPQCKAMFRVVADQLKLRGGLVRCGTCRHVFDAIGSLTYVDDATVKAAPIEPRAAGRKEPALSDGSARSSRRPAPAPSVPKEQSRPITLRIAPEPMSVPVARARRDDEHALRGRATQPADAGVPTLIFAEEATDILPPLAEEVAPTSPRRRARAPELKSDAKPAPRSAPKRDADLPPPPVTEPPGAPAQEAATAPAARTAAPATPTDVKPIAGEPATETGSDRATAPSFLQRSERRSFPLAYALGSVVMLGFIAIQLAVLFRTELITRFPGSRPMLVSICGWYGCNVGWPTRAELLAVVGTELQLVPGTDVLDLTTVVRNRASFRVALPAPSPSSMRAEASPADAR